MCLCVYTYIPLVHVHVEARGKPPCLFLRHIYFVYLTQVTHLRGVSRFLLDRLHSPCLLMGYSFISGLSDSARLVASAVRPSNQIATWPVVPSIFLFVNGGGRNRKSGFMLAYQAVHRHHSLKLPLLFQERVSLCNSPCYPGSTFVDEAHLELLKILLPLPLP